MCLIKLVAKITAKNLGNAERADYYRKIWEETPHFDVTFYRKDGKWYTDLPGVAEEKRRLIGGSEIFLNEYSGCINYDNENCKPDMVKMEVYTDRIPEWTIRLVLDKEEKGGYRYLAGDGFFRILSRPDSKVFPGYELWLGKGVDQIFGAAPDFLYVSFKYT